MLVVANPIYFSALPKAVADILNNPITLGAVCAVVLNLVFNGRAAVADAAPATAADSPE